MKWARHDKFALANIVIATFGFLLVFSQLRLATSEFNQSQLHQRAQFLSRLHDRAFGSTAIKDVFRKIEYQQIKYDENFHNSEDQKALIELLSFLEFLGQLERLNLIHMSDISEIFGYYIIRVHENPEVQKYRQFLDTFVGTSDRPSGGVTFRNFDRIATTIRSTKSQSTGRRAP